MNTERIKEIQQETGYPESVSVQQALLKVWNETAQELKAGQHETIVMCSVSEMGAIAKMATEKRELEYSINGFHENPPKFSVGDVRVILEALNEVKRT